MKSQNQIYSFSSEELYFRHTGNLNLYVARLFMRYGYLNVLLPFREIFRISATPDVIGNDFNSSSKKM